MRTGIANLPLHGGRCPAWLFTHMKKLGAAIVEVIIEESGPEEVLRRLSDPFWFQSLGCVLGFDWHSSGLTTTVCGALKEGLAELGPQAGIFFAGGKGKVSRNTPQEIEYTADKYPLNTTVENLIYASRMSAKIDNTAVQDGYQIYHHFFAFTSSGEWAVIQQGMNDSIGKARRYHWLGSKLTSFTEEPHTAICSDKKGIALNLVAQPNRSLREETARLANISPPRLIKELKIIEKDLPNLNLPFRHSIPRTNYLNKSLFTAFEQQPQSFEMLLNIKGVGPGTLRALCLLAEVTFGIKASYTDPVRYSFAHGGKDGYPFPVNETDMEHSYNTLKKALHKARLGKTDQLTALKNLAKWYSKSALVMASPLPDNDEAQSNSLKL